MTPTELIREIIYKGEITQTKLADLIGVKQATISRLRHKKNGMSVKTARALIRLGAKYNIHVTLEELLMD